MQQSLLRPAAIVTTFTNLGGMSRHLFGMSVIQSRKGWGSRGGPFAEGSRTVSVAVGIFAKLLVHLLNGATFFTAGEEGSIVAHNGSVIPGKHKTNA